MIRTAKISTSWKEPLAAAAYATGVSLHSHTSYSEESLRFIHALGMAIPGVTRLTRRYETRCRERYGIALDFDRANWRPPLQPRMAYEVEAGQIERLGLRSLVSITDHDTMEGSLLLRTLPTHSDVGGVVGRVRANCLPPRNSYLPSAEGAHWMERFRALTASPDDRRLLRTLRELHEERQVLTVLNHPLWDLHTRGPVHVAELQRFLAEAGQCLHALELNGLRHAQENRQVARLARDTEYLLISGGDRHGLEPNANINLTSAKSFTEFVDEVRVERLSHVHFMEQYQGKWEQRILRSTLNAITDFPQFMPGWQRWDERAFHPDAQGVMRPFRELWVGGRPPRALFTAIQIVRLGSRRGVSAPLSLAFLGVNRLGAEMDVV